MFKKLRLNRGAITRVQGLIIAVILIVAVAAGVMYYMFLMPKPSEEPIKIGAVLPLTGPLAKVGLYMKQGALIAQDYVNERGGVLGRPLEIVFGDSELKPEKGVAAAELMVTRDKVVGFAGVLSSAVSLAIIESVVDKYKLPFIVVASWVDKITEMHNKYVFRVCPFTSYLLDPWYNFIADSGAERVGGLTYSDKIGIEAQNALFERLKEEGFEITHDMFHAIEQTDFVAELTKIKENEPDILFSASIGLPALQMIKQHGELGLKCLILKGTVAELLTEEGWEVVGDYGNYHLMIAEWFPGLEYTDLTEEVRTRYKDAYEVEPTYITMNQFDATFVMCDAINRAGTTDPDAIVTAIETTKLEATCGEITFEMEPTGPLYHQYKKPFVVIQFQNRKPEVVWPPQHATSTLLWL